MTISSTLSEVTYSGDDVSTVFTIPFVFDDQTDLKVVETDPDGNASELGSGFSITGGNGNTGTLTKTSPLLIGYRLTILDDPELTQPTDYIDNDDFPAETHERALDRGVRISKRLYQLLLRCFRFPDGDPITTGVIGSVDNRKGKYLFFNAVSGAIEYAANLVTTTLTQSIIAQLLNPQSAAEANAGVTPTNYFRDYGDLRRYGAVGDGATDSAPAWALANAQSAVGGAPIRVPKTTSGFAVASGVTVDYRSDVEAEGGARLIYTGLSNLVVVDVGSAVNIATDRTWRMPTIERQNQSDWSSENSVGVRFRNCTDCLIFLPLVNGHTIGAQTLPAGGNGFQHNRVFLGGIYGSKFGIDLSNATNGYTNENTFYDGRFTVFSGVNNTVARYGIRITSSDATYLSNNNNVFLHPSFELNAPDTSGEALPILSVHGQQNKFLYCRDEINDATFARESNAATGNWYDVGYFATFALPVIDCQSSAPGYKVTNSGLGAVYPHERQIFDSGPMHKNWNNYDGAGAAIHVPNVNLGFSGSGASVFIATTGVTPNAAYLDITGGGPGVFVNTDECKQFVVSRQCEAGRGGRVVVVCYDAIDGGGSIITTAGSVKGAAHESFSAIGGFGGAFSTGGDSNNDVLFTVTAAVKSVRVLVVAGTATVRIRQFSIRAVNTLATPGTYVGYAEIAAGQGIATAVPTTGTYPAGKFLRNAAPATDGNNMTLEGWICTTGGTPGTWAISRTSTVSPAT